MLILILSAWVATAQDPPGFPPQDAYHFTIEQGWKLTPESERELFVYTKQDLLKGLKPKVTNSPMMLCGGDSVKIEGTLSREADELVLSFQKVDFSDSGQRWRIDVEPAKITTLDLGGGSPWHGTPKEWTARLDLVVKALLEPYLRAMTPQKLQEPKPRVGLAIASQEGGRRLYVTQCLEDQLAFLFLTSLGGARLPRTAWPSEGASFPKRSVQSARALVERLVLQCAGELAPPRFKNRSVKGAPWEGAVAALPALPWSDGTAWLAEEMKPFEEARRRLGELARELARKYPSQSGPLYEQEWSAALEREFQGLQSRSSVEVPEKAPTLKDTLLEPRLIVPGKGIYDCKENLDLKDGTVIADTLEARGLMKEMEVAFFVSGPNRWHASKVEVETWYHGKVQRQ